MKNYFNLSPSTDFHTIRDYVIELDNQVWSLVDYIQNFNPNYQILNYIPQSTDVYYENKELETLNIIEITTKTVPDPKDPQKTIKIPDTITVNINFLPQHFGLYNNFSLYEKDKRFWTDQHGIKRIWNEGTVIISKKKNTLPIADEPDFRYYKNFNQLPNYFIARLSAAATFYIFSFQNLGQPTFNWFYDSKAEETYGTTFYTTFISYQPRFLHTQGLQLYNNDYQEEFYSYRINNNQLIQYIETQQHSQWTNGYLLNHEIIWGSEDNLEECICDDLVSVSISNLDNSKIPTYNIGIKDGKLANNIYINLW